MTPPKAKQRHERKHGPVLTAYRQAREAWEQSDDYVKAMGASILLDPRHVPYLRNRLLMAFDSGWMAREALSAHEGGR